MASVLGRGAFPREREQRVLAFAMLASIILHAVLLYGGVGRRDADRRPQPAPVPIAARLALPRPVAVPAPAVEEPRAVEAPPPVAKPPPPVIAKPAPKAVATAISKPAPPAAVPRPIPAAPSPDPVKPAAETAPDAPSAPPAVQASPGPPIARADPQPVPPIPADADAGNVAQYRMAFYLVAKRYKKYPRVALDNNWEGKGTIHLGIGANGMIASVSVKTSTGHKILDEASIETVRKAKPLVPIPASLRGREFGVDIQFTYNLTDGNF